ncbi:type I-C CRISPR-associated protein Cas8c/Csd1 [Pedomonas mirosovicensis]|uniref:type I-C CRISPR-associated protein Cas8c/Csd1 n=1 Tax=Pedomonas mirosovicensis TaxID=2908641 RepID=UPI002169962B|nr:type I-C CRISPR-associated protein Cas8c/Csd1 [Pedomonas mirosovicensis]MCH8686603.1 type I-C CRISPR-associated protein Cas8c/Csd1 [Pedomonas mirosovicensis]
MTILQALERHYHRLAERGEISSPGWSREKFGFCVVLSRDGEPVAMEDLRDLLGKKPVNREFTVPASFKRSGKRPPPFFLWDKTSYSLGVGAEGKGWKETPFQHGLFKEYHLNRLSREEDPGLLALVRFLQTWEPSAFRESCLKEIVPDANIMFRLDGDREYLHERAAARRLVEAGNDNETDQDQQVGWCLITGEQAPIEKLHPAIKGVAANNPPPGGGHSLVSFNLDAFTSLCKTQGANAPTSKGAAFRYGTTLNHLLTRGGPNRLPHPIGDATVVFWAEAGDDQADALFANWLGGDTADDDASETRKLREQMQAVASGKRISDVLPQIDPDTRFHVLGLSPNAARLSVRFWLSDTIDAFAHRLARHHEDLRIEPTPLNWGAAPSVNCLLVNTTALQRDFKNIPPLLAGEVMRAVLGGTRYPLSLLSAALIRLRAGDSPATGWHAAVIRAVLVRLKRRHSEFPEEGETPMSLKRDHDNVGYQLGRLFAVYELAQRAALGRVNATIRDKYFGAASATPASVFPLIVRGGQNHLAKVRKEKPGWASLIERELEEIHSHIEPAAPRSLPRSLSLQDQGEFAIGYYHQRAASLSNGKNENIDPKELEDLQGEGDEK